MAKHTDPLIVASENRAFLRELAATGNVREAARRIGRAYATMQHRRGRSMGFAQAWEAALALAQARLHEAGAFRPERGRMGAEEKAHPQPLPRAGGEKERLPLRRAGGEKEGHRTLGGEGVVIRRNDGRLQFRRAQPGKLTRACEQAFLLALAATCNVKLAAAAVGTQNTHFYRRKLRDKGFAREWLLALEEGYARLELACLEASRPEAHAHDGWSRNERPALPPMTWAQALQLMYLHQKEARLQAEPPHVKRRRGESVDAHWERLKAMRAAADERARDQFRIAEAVRHARGEATYLPWEPPVLLPDLGQVTGWSRAGEGKVHDERRALFGGWRIEHMADRLNEPCTRDTDPDP